MTCISKQRIGVMEKGQEFLMSVPFISNFACKQVESERVDIEQNLHTLILYNLQKALKRGMIFMLCDRAH
ncbi:MAG: hypothetical protein WCG34_03715 [Leptolinea sp.]